MTQPTTTKRKGFRPITYIGEIINELKKVVWLSRREIVYLTGLVLIVTIITGVVLGGLDFGFTNLIGALFG